MAEYLAFKGMSRVHAIRTDKYRASKDNGDWWRPSMECGTRILGAYGGFVGLAKEIPITCPRCLKRMKKEADHG